MTVSSRSVAFSLRNKSAQRGAIGLMATLLLILVLGFLMLAVDSGRLYMEKRSVQRIADMAALEAAARGGNCLGNAPTTAQTYAEQNASARNNFSLDSTRSLSAVCGNVTTVAGHRQFTADADGRAIQVAVAHTVPASLVLGGWFGNNVQLSATATAGVSNPLAQLTLRTSLVSVDSAQSALLNTLFSGLLGGSVNLDVSGWQGLANTDIDLLGYLDQLALDQGLTIGDYQSVLDTGVSAGELLDVAATALQLDARTADADAAIAGLELLAAAVPGGDLLMLGDLLNMQSGLPVSGLAMNLNALQLVQGIVQLANSQNAAVATLPISVPGVAGVTLQVKVIEPPQLSAIGDPELASLDPEGPDQIYVRSAQVRALVSVALPVNGGVVSGLVNTVTSSLGPVTGFLEDALSLNLVSGLGDLLSSVICFNSSCKTGDFAYAELLGSERLDIGLDLGSADARVTDYSCSADGSKSLLVDAATSAVNLRLGSFGKTATDAKNAVFSSNQLPVVAPASVLALGTQVGRPSSCTVFICSDLKWKVGANTWVEDRSTADFTVKSGFGLKVDSSVVADSQTLTFSAPDAEQLPELGLPANFVAVNANNDILDSLGGALSGVDIEPYTSNQSGILGGLLTTGVSTINGVLSTVEGLIDGLLAPLLDPVLSQLTNSLGIDLAKADVGANLSCGGRGRAELLL
ncbi:hypothetical protein AX279_24110 [Pseudomonas sp. J237]|nr:MULTISPECIES: pilus assembly protein TadG-related protein [Pseudomonas]OEO23394.1 hypothetical protein AX279_24110 [Pseudomonas sp. J237]